MKNAHIKEILVNSRKKTYNVINFAMVEAYWEIGKSIVEMQGGNYTSDYGKQLIKDLSKKLTIDYGNGLMSLIYVEWDNFIYVLKRRWLWYN